MAPARLASASGERSFALRKDELPLASIRRSGDTLDLDRGSVADARGQSKFRIELRGEVRESHVVNYRARAHPADGSSIGDAPRATVRDSAAPMPRWP